MRTALRLVDPPESPEVVNDDPELALATLLPRLALLETYVAECRRRIDQERRRLANKRGVSFLRFEHVRSEFGDAR